MPALDSVCMMIDIGLYESFWLPPAWKAARSELNSLVALFEVLLELLLEVESLSVPLEVACA